MPTELAQKRSVLTKVFFAVRDDIHRGKYLPGQRLPTLAALADKYGVSHSTVRLALKELAASGIIEMRHGSGTFVAPKKLTFDPTQPFADHFTRLGKTPRIETRYMQWEDPHRDAAEILNIEQGEQVWSVLQVGYVDETAAAALVTDIPRGIANHLMGDSRRIDLMLDTLRNELGYDDLDIDVIKVDILSERFYWELLNLPAGTALYEVRRVVSSRGEPLMMSYVGMRADRFCLDFRGGDRFKHKRLGAGNDCPDWKDCLYERLTQRSRNQKVVLH